MLIGRRRRRRRSLWWKRKLTGKRSSFRRMWRLLTGMNGLRRM
jgi:hypothetical protein